MGDAACGVGDLGDVAAVVKVVDGGVAVAVLDGLALVGVVGGHGDGLALPVGLAGDAPIGVVFALEQQAAERIAVVSERVGHRGSVVGVGAGGADFIAHGHEVACAVVAVGQGFLARRLDLLDAAVGVAHKLQCPAAAVADAGVGDQNAHIDIKKIY